jgi:hypothetical protein
MQYVPVPSLSGSRTIDGNAPYPAFGAGGNIAGLTAYGYLNQQWYAELGAYGTSRGLLSFMSAGLNKASTTQLRGLNPYWRLAWNHSWGAHNLMLGTTGMVARAYDDPLDTSDPSTLHETTDLTLDAQYQYLLDPHSVTAQFVLTSNKHRLPAALGNQPVPYVDATGSPLANTNGSDTNHLLRAKLTYVYQARYGGSLGVFKLAGTSDTAYLTPGYAPASAPPSAGDPGGNRSGSPATRGLTLEAFCMPIQNLRLGAQVTAYQQFNGASQNYDGYGRNASDNNSLFIYSWLAY